MESLQRAEVLRQRYLQAMGIGIWLPRRPLPGAAPSPRWHWQVPEPDAPVPTPRPGGGEALAPAAPRAGDVRARLGLARRAETPPQDAATSEPDTSPQPDTSSRPAPEETPRFRLLVVQYEDILVLDELPLDSRQPVSQAHRNLLHAVLRAVGRGAGSGQELIASWPLFAPESGYDQSLPVARQFLRQEIGLAEMAPDLPLLLLGRHTPELLLEPGEERSGLVITGPSLTEMLRIPLRKAELWQALQPLCR